MLSWSEMVSYVSLAKWQIHSAQSPYVPASHTDPTTKRPWKPRKPSWETIFRIPIVCAAYIV